ncbi:FKBP6 [Lepeophtheirus salmonis]|uniref:peptidylprolyl isomerase n=1 Tax=Lepeophtheirus salmonis TaxID=72036 RepID=A0A7R8CWC1_LEPSM|nr:FKBP6 [Lepeophtheirus salmonis]CAF2951512.1 FKBP6 [Lepeophtheirus salmonis]
MEDILSYDALGSLDIHEVEEWTPLEDVEGVEKKVLDAGTGIRGIGDKDVVVCHYSFTIEGETEPYDSSLLRSKRERLKMGHVVPGIEFALRSMKKSERSAFRIQPHLAYGPLGCPPRIPASSVILAEIRVYDFLDSRSSKELLRRPHELAQNYSFQYIYDLLYESGIKLFEFVVVANDEQEELRKILLHKLRLNVGLCYLQTGKHALTCATMEQVLLDEPDNVRALYRMGKAKRILGGEDHAKHYLKKAYSLAPSDPDIRRELINLKKGYRFEEKV